MKLLVWGCLVLLAYEAVAPPVSEKKKKEELETNEVDQQVIDVEYKRYLQEVVQVLEGDEDFRQRLMKADPEDIKSGKISSDLEFVNHNVRSKLDELKRQELERLRHLAIKQNDQENGIDRKHIKIPAHVDPQNPHTFEAEDLRKLIVQTTKELEDADRQRKDEFKEYEMQKELTYQEQLKHLDEQNRKEAEKQHHAQEEKHKKHPSLHHPGSKPQLEQVWEEQDHMSPEDFNPKTFFHLHDLDGNGVWDAVEVKALFKKELDKMYDPNAPEDDVRERYEEMERMREHIFNETDTNKDQLITFQEFLEQTKRSEFERDEGWESIDQQQQPVYSDDEYKRYAQQHEDEIRRMIDQGLIPPAPPGYHPMVIPPGHGQEQHMPPGAHPQQHYIPASALHGQQQHFPPGGAHPQQQQHHLPPGSHPQQPAHHMPPNGVPFQVNAGQDPGQHGQAQGYHPQGGQHQGQQYQHQPMVPPSQQHYPGGAQPQQQQVPVQHYDQPAQQIPVQHHQQQPLPASHATNQQHHDAQQQASEQGHGQHPSEAVGAEHGQQHGSAGGAPVQQPPQH